jgi:hypothetical protein
MMESIKTQQAAERLAAEQQEVKRLAAERQAADSQAAEKRAAERMTAERTATKKLAADKLALELLTSETPASERQILEKQLLDRLAQGVDPEGLSAELVAKISERAKIKKAPFETKKKPRPSSAVASPARPPSPAASDLLVDPYHSSVAYGQPLAAHPYQTNFGGEAAPASTTTEKAAVVVNGQAFLDMSGGTRHVTDLPLPLRRVQLEEDAAQVNQAVGPKLQQADQAVMEPDGSTRREDEDPEINGVEAVTSAPMGGSAKKPEEEFTAELCEKLRVPCRCVIYRHP